MADWLSYLTLSIGQLDLSLGNASNRDALSGGPGGLGWSLSYIVVWRLVQHGNST